MVPGIAFSKPDLVLNLLYAVPSTAHCIPPYPAVRLIWRKSLLNVSYLCARLLREILTGRFSWPHNRPHLTIVHPTHARAPANMYCRSNLVTWEMTSLWCRLMLPKACPRENHCSVVTAAATVSHIQRAHCHLVLFLDICVGDSSPAYYMYSVWKPWRISFLSE